MPAFIVATVSISNMDAFKEYSKTIVGVSEKYGGESIVKGMVTEMLEGSAPEDQRVVVSKFPDAEAAKLEREAQACAHDVHVVAFPRCECRADRVGDVEGDADRVPDSVVDDLWSSGAWRGRTPERAWLRRRPAGSRSPWRPAPTSATGAG